MSISRRVTLFSTCMVFFVVTAPGFVRAEKPGETITGVIKAADVYKGKVQSVYIKDLEKGSFLVLRGTPVAKALTRNVGATVKATGHVRKARPDSDFERVIDVLSYEIVPAEAPDAAPAPPEERPPGGSS